MKKFLMLTIIVPTVSFATITLIALIMSDFKNPFYFLKNIICLHLWTEKYSAEIKFSIYKQKNLFIKCFKKIKITI